MTPSGPKLDTCFRSAFDPKQISRSMPARLDLLSPQSASSCLGFKTVAFAGLGAPKATPADVIEKLNREVNLGLADSKLKQRIIDLGGEPLQLSAAEFGKFVAEETDKWDRGVKFSGAKPN